MTGADTIAIDSSAVMAIAFREPDGDVFSALIAAHQTLIATSTLVEVTMVLSRGIPDFAEAFVAAFLARRSVKAVDFSFPMYEAAAHAFRRFGKGQGHPAQLNYGDCMSYALAKVHGVPLLYKGEDFARTDIVPAFAG